MVSTGYILGAWDFSKQLQYTPAVFLGQDPRRGRARGILRLRLTCFSLDSGHIKEVIVAAEVDPGDNEMAEASGSPDPQGPGLAGQGEQAQLKLLVNEDGRYVCALCHKTFKTVSPRSWAVSAKGTRPPAQGAA